MPADSTLSPLQQSVAVIQDLKSQLQAERERRAEPIAIIGMGCRFPGGADDPEAFWQNLVSGVDAMAEVPPDRWDVDAYYDPDPTAPGKIYTRLGGFVADVDKFDAGFFGIAPREAASMDPQQRLVLETAWQALENAGVVPSRLRGRPVGIFIGVCQTDYAHLQLYAGDGAAIQAHDGAGNGACFIAGRLSYVLGTQGPSLAIDTACSSSLVAVHLACASLRAGECELALVGGVQTILSPTVSILMSRLEALSPDGRCHTFDADACGYARGEGCGVVVLKRLADAVRDGDRVAAVVLSSAVNHDGPSSGLTVPNQGAQEALIREALTRARVAPNDVGYVECHGTGTVLGDPIEVEALGAVFAGQRSDDLLIGSVKTNIGHLEAAAGIAGLIKAALSIERAVIPPHLNFRRGNPRINWDRLPFEVPTRPTAWPMVTRRVAGVSAFGMSGTNAHVVLAAPDAMPAASPPAIAVETAPSLLFLSAKTATALRALAARYASFLSAHPELMLRDLAWSLAMERSRLPYWLVFAATTPAEAIAALTRWSPGEKAVASLAGRGREIVFRSTPAEPAVDAVLRRAEALLVSGDTVDWSAVLAPGRRLSLPTYPFERQRYWVSEAGPSDVVPDVTERPTAVSALLQAGDAAALVRLIADRLGDLDRHDVRRVVETMIERDHAERVGRESWLYRIAWRHQPLTSRARAPDEGSFLILADRGPIGPALAQALTMRGAKYVLVAPPSDPAGAGWVAEAIARLPGKLRVVVYLAGADEREEDWRAGADLMASLRRALGGAASVVRELRSGALWLVTRGTAGGGSALGSAMWGLGRAVAAERPELRVRLIDLPADLADRPERVASHLAEELEGNDGDEEIAYDAAGGRRVTRLERVTAEAAAPLTVMADGSYLLSGGTGELGLITAEWLVARGARHLVLAARHGPGNEAAQRIAALRRAGAKVEIVVADAADETSLAQIIARLPRLKGVVHAAGIVDDGALSAQSWERVAAVLSAKTVGAWAIERLTRQRALDWIVLYSSASSVLGSAGQAGYAAANGFMDGLALKHRAVGRPMSSIAWGSWSGGGMAGRLDARQRARLSARGLRPIARDRGVQALEEALLLGLGHVVVLDIDWLKYAASGGARQLVTDFAAVSVAGAGANRAAALQAAPPALRRLKLRELVTEVVRRVLALGEDQLLDPDQGFFDLGMDSTIAVDLRRRLDAELGTELPSTIGFEHSTIAALTDYLAQAVFGWEEKLGESAPMSETARRADSAARLEGMSEAEVETLLAERLKRL